MSSNSCFSVLLLLLTYTLLAKLVCAQQQLPPTPYIPANRPAGTTVTKTVIESRPATEDGSSSPTTSPKPHFMPTYGSSLSLPGGTNIAAASSIWQALTSVQSTWTAGPAYPSITSAVYQAAPSSARASLDAAAGATYDWDQIVQEPWYTSAVPAPVQSLISAQEQALQGTFDNLTASAGGLSSRGGRGVVVAGVVVVAVGLGVRVW
ncbi:uncharacterized protein L3040_001428 [Drepanopeziza brunnea f. sp. 'multigermtubi']|uniref:uncharacterized protein n=1 Tax=Drepanopeziza brunnea f. sp. 'multigermtubi' TaxID=698441 RepID=UPI002393A714|nr:hypothetical protein L3040_001428 [Drepanopeziza brunnea f. sp. 'multigermtubi']